jgi:hypothetical protein
LQQDSQSLALNDVAVESRRNASADCPFCHADIVLPGDLEGYQGESPIVVCTNCKRRIHLTRYFWVNKGINVGSRRVLRCPRCYKLFAEGDYSDRPQRIKCRDCGCFSVFQRIC